MSRRCSFLDDSGATASSSAGTWTSEIAETLPIEMIAAANATVEIGETEIEIVSAAAAPRLAVDPPLAGIFGMQET